MLFVLGVLNMAIYVLSVFFILGCFAGTTLGFSFWLSIIGAVVTVFIYYFMRKEAFLIILTVFTGLLIGTVHISNDTVTTEGTLTVTVQELMIEGDYSARYICKMDKLQIIINIVNPQETYSPGDILEFTDSNYIISVATNPGQFSQEDYYKSKGWTRGVIQVSGSNVKVTGQQITLPKVRGLLKTGLSNSISKNFDIKSIPWVKALILGDRSELDKTTKDNMINTGVYHVLALSGLHIGLIAIFMSRALSVFPMGENRKSLIIIGCVLLYILIIGFRPSLIRAGIAILMIYSAALFSKRYSPLVGLSIAGAIIIGFSPYSLYDGGFWLSLSSVMGIIIFYKPIRRFMQNYIKNEYILDLFSISLAAQFATMPLTLYYFNTLPIISPLSNLLIIPLVFIIMILLWFYVIVGVLFQPLGFLVASITVPLLHFLDHIIRFLSGFKTDITMPTPPLVAVIIFYSAVIICPLLKKYSKRNLILVALSLSFVIYLPVFFPSNNLEVVFLDVGQGDAMHISTPGGRHILIDGGERVAGDRVVIPYLKDRGVKKIDIVFLSHSHSDHMDGLIPVIETLPVGLAIIPRIPFTDSAYNGFLHLLNNRNIPVVRAYRGHIIEVERDIYIEVIHPGEKAIIGTNSDLNNNSIVFYLYYKDITMLFTGDIEKEGEHFIRNLLIDCDILKVAHHGSVNSTTTAFLNRTNPQVAVISTGKNRYGHPHDEILRRLKNRSIQTFRTDISGAITIKTDGSKIFINEYNKKNNVVVIK